MRYSGRNAARFCQNFRALHSQCDRIKIYLCKKDRDSVCGKKSSSETLAVGEGRLGWGSQWIAQGNRVCRRGDSEGGREVITEMTLIVSNTNKE